jgi:gamma-glutamyltranspeptidase/glutathione hydrolase
MRARTLARRPAAWATLGLLVLGLVACQTLAREGIIGSSTYRPEVRGRLGVVAAGRHFAAEAGMRMLARGGNAIDAGVAATFAAAVTEISHFGLGGEVPILIHLADRGDIVVVNGQGTAPASASVDAFRRQRRIPVSGPSAGTVPAVVDALCIALAEFGTLSLAEALAPAIELADGFPWYDFLTLYLRRELERVAALPSGARVYLQGPGGTIPELGSVFRQPELAATLRALVEAERHQAAAGRAAAIYAARELFHRGDVGLRIARAVQQAGGLLTEADLASYRGRVERPTRQVFRTRHGTFEVSKTGFWGQGPALLQALAMLQGFDLVGMGHNSVGYIHTVAEALKLALADRDAFYADPDFAEVPTTALLSDAYAAVRRGLIDARAANNDPRPGEPWTLQRPAGGDHRPRGGRTPVETARTAMVAESPDTTSINVADARGNLFSAAPSSAWFFGGVFIAGDTGVPLGNRMQAFVLDPSHPNVVQGGKRPRTTLSPTIVLRDGRPFFAMSSPGGDSQEQQALQVFLNIAVFDMRPQAAVEAPRFNTFHYRESFGEHRRHAGTLQVESRIAPDVVDGLRALGHRVGIIGPFMMDTGTSVAGIESREGTLFGAADVRRQRFVTGW